MLYSNTTGTGQDLVLLHGWGFNADLFNPLVNQYKNTYRITTIDLPGHGRSDEVSGGIDNWCNEIIKIMPKNPILLGWSLGGLLAINIATKIQTKKLILVASTPKFVKTNNWKLGIDEQNFKEFSDNLNLNLSKGLKRFVSLQSSNREKIKELNKSIENLPATNMALNQGLKILLETDLTNEYLNLDIEKQVILGDKDTLVPSAIENWYKDNNAKTAKLNTGHIPFLEKEFSL